MSEITVQGRPIPTENPLQVGVKPSDGFITDVGHYTHAVDWVGSGPSVVRYCNVCGSAMHYRGVFVCDDGVTRDAKVCVCGAFLGFI